MTCSTSEGFHRCTTGAEPVKKSFWPMSAISRTKSLWSNPTQRRSQQPNWANCSNTTSTTLTTPSSLENNISRWFTTFTRIKNTYSTRDSKPFLISMTTRTLFRKALWTKTSQLIPKGPAIKIPKLSTSWTLFKLNLVTTPISLNPKHSFNSTLIFKKCFRRSTILRLPLRSGTISLIFVTRI